MNQPATRSEPSQTAKCCPGNTEADAPDPAFVAAMVTAVRDEAEGVRAVRGVRIGCALGLVCWVGVVVALIYLFG